MRFGIGEPVQRTEDPLLLRGQGRYTDDLNEPGQAYAWIVRSPHAHGFLRNINTRISKEMPGVLAIYTAADLAAYGPHKCALDFKQRDGSPMRKPIRKSLATDKVRFVGDPGSQGSVYARALNSSNLIASRSRSGMSLAREGR